MKPIDAVRDLYRQQPCGRTFDDDLAVFLRIGYVFSTPTAFIMGKAIPSHEQTLRWDYHDINATCSEEEADSWMIWLAAGDLGEFFRYEPTPKKWIAWARKGVLRFHPFNRVRELCTTSTAFSIFPLSGQTVALRP